MSSDPLWQGYRAGEAFWGAIGGFFRWIFTILGGFLFPSFRVRSRPRGREGRETRALYDKVKRLFDATPLGQGGGNSFAVALAFEAFERAERKPYIELIEPFINATVDLMVEDGLWGLPEVDWERPWGLEEGVELRKFLGAQSRFFGNYERYVDIWREKLIRTYEGMLGYFPEELTLDERRDDEELPPGWSVPLIDLAYDVPEVIERLIATVWDKDVVDTGLYGRMRERFDWNALVASGIDPKNQGTTSRPVVFPTKARCWKSSVRTGNFCRWSCGSCASAATRTWLRSDRAGSRDSYY